jgi:hypothetical protein
MPIIRGHHSFDDQFTQIPNAWLRDDRLTLKARGLLAQVLSHRENWSLSVTKLASDNQEGKSSIRNAIAELEKFGYLERDQLNEKGRFGEAVYFTRDPYGLPESDLPLTDEPLSDLPLSDNRTHKKNTLEEEQLQEEHKENYLAIFDKFWQEYPRKVDRGAALRAFKSALKRSSEKAIIDGAIAYAKDPDRDVRFTKYPATWLNADSWLNTTAQASEPPKKSDIERAKTREYLDELDQAAQSAAPPPKCEHDANPALCKICLRGLR